MRKTWMSMLVLCMTLLSSQTFWYFENKAYCSFKDKNVTISIKKVEWSERCSVYMDTVYQLALKKYNEVSTIRWYISQWEDVYYWKWVLEEKKSEFLQLINYRTQIKTAIVKFESALFDKYYNALKKPMQNYYSELEVQYYAFLNQDTNLTIKEYSLKRTQMEQQIMNVKSILDAKNLDEIMGVVPSYFYLKDQLRWK